MVFRVGLTTHTVAVELKVTSLVRVVDGGGYILVYSVVSNLS